VGEPAPGEPEHEYPLDEQEAAFWLLAWLRPTDRALSGWVPAPWCASMAAGPESEVVNMMSLRLSDEHAPLGGILDDRVREDPRR
jgi:hypothetical protein